MTISGEKYVNLITYTKDGREKPAPVWIVDLGTDDAGKSQVGFTTWNQSWKAKRVRTTPKVTLQPCDSRGRITPGSAIVSGTAQVVTGPQFDEVKAKVKDKYGVMVGIISAMNLVRGLLGKGGQSDSAVIITLT